MIESVIKDSSGSLPQPDTDVDGEELQDDEATLAGETMEVLRESFAGLPDLNFDFINQTAIPSLDWETEGTETLIPQEGYAKSGRRQKT
ncbi:hypothetical protein CYMTET_17513 [Cymbomonas tetramitiformis]|uniref:Uncharacterized protein n=1 Tax=Cymbomonas tetramitiformis TaxID=36881 RepID=A0AAE0L788_9CHLO|nr:hypothetical protein CYMTET_17513 [Cymbomonas tetramitiformis]